MHSEAVLFFNCDVQKQSRDYFVLLVMNKRCNSG